MCIGQYGFELKFLQYIDVVLNKIHLIDRGPSISYNINDKPHTYFIDFIIKGTNCVFEIKSKYFWNKSKEINIIKKYEAEKLYNYNLIIDNDFSNLMEIFEKYEK